MDFAIAYRAALTFSNSESDQVSGASNCDMNLRKFELSEEDWIVATNLRDHDVVKVSQSLVQISDCFQQLLYEFHLWKSFLYEMAICGVTVP